LIFQELNRNFTKPYYPLDNGMTQTKMKKLSLLFIFIASVLISYSQTQETDQEAQSVKELKEKETYEKYINNSLENASTPYADCYGVNKHCPDEGCSEISIKSPLNSDVLVTIKSEGQVVRHAYICAGNMVTFEVPDGTYQPFFYFGKGWDPDKPMNGPQDCNLKGGFISEESFGKDFPQRLENSILEYELIVQSSGNFSTIPCDPDEAF
jgi:hypothetical protein